MDKSRECKKDEHESCTRMGCPCRCHTPARKPQTLTGHAVRAVKKIVK